MKVVVCTAHDAAYAELAAITLPSVRAYCKRHGYYLLYDGDRKPEEKDACKIALYREAYGAGEFGPDDVFAWIDTDAVICNSERRIENIVYEHMPRWCHYLIGCDINGINSGFFIARFSLEAAAFMTVASDVSVVSGWADQIGLAQVSLMEPHRSIYREVPGKVFNCNDYALKGWSLDEFGNYVNQYEPGDFVCHLAGVEEPTRSQRLRELAAEAK
jgi:hypothetical protein